LGYSPAGAAIGVHRVAGCLVVNAAMAPGLCLPDDHLLVAIPGRGGRTSRHRVGHRTLPMLEGGVRESGKGIEKRINGPIGEEIARFSKRATHKTSLTIFGIVLENETVSP
jgi:hypothetical protein